MKLNYYFAFKTAIDKDLEKFLRDKIQEEQLKFDSDTDMGMFHQKLESTKRNQLINKKKSE
jgi:hypothetical protein